MILEQIFNAIKFGAALLRARAETIIFGPLSPAEVQDVLATAAKSCPDAIDYNKSVVDLMKILHLDSSLPARQRLAAELGYPKARDGSAEMNIWLHDMVMKEVANRIVVGPAG